MSALTMNLQPVRNGAHRIGAMTAVMRAAASPLTSVRVPRVAVVLGGRIADERIFREAPAITVGTAEDATFTVAGHGLPARFVLFERVGSKHYLRFVDGMSGRIAMGDARYELAELRAKAHEARGAWRVELSKDARGKIVVGDATFLFQLVVPPPAPSRPHLPLGVLDGIAGQIDWRLAIIAAMSFLVHFAIVGGAYSDWMDPVVETDRSVGALIDLQQKLPPLPPEPIPDHETTTNDAPAKVVAKAPSTTKGTPAKGRPHTSESTAADLVARANQIEVGMVVALNGGPATQIALDRSSEIPPVDLESAARSQAGTAEKASPFGGHSGGPVKAGKDGLAALAGDGTKKSGDDGPGTIKDTAGPVIDVHLPPPTTTGNFSDADRVVAGLRSRLRKCYQQGLARDPSMSGKTVLSAKVAPNGEVASVDVVENEGLDAKTTACMANVVHGAQFTGNGSFGTVRIPVTMLQQK